MQDGKWGKFLPPPPGKKWQACVYHLFWKVKSQFTSDFFLIMKQNRSFETLHHYINSRAWRVGRKHCATELFKYSRRVCLLHPFSREISEFPVSFSKNGQDCGCQILIFKVIGAASEDKKCKTFCKVFGIWYPWGMGRGNSMADLGETESRNTRSPGKSEALQVNLFQNSLGNNFETMT